jgi:hypothetical protein
MPSVSSSNKSFPHQYDVPALLIRRASPERPGIIATSDIPNGTLIVSEPPLFTLPPTGLLPNDPNDNNFIAIKLLKLDEAQERTSLVKREASNLPTRMSTCFSTNAIRLGSGPTQARSSQLSRASTTVVCATQSIRGIREMENKESLRTRTSAKERRSLSGTSRRRHGGKPELIVSGIS